MLAFKYISLSVIMFLLITITFYITNKNYLEYSKKAISNTIKLIIILTAWLTYVAVLSFTKVLLDYSMPPRFPILLIIPFFTFCVLFYRKNKQNAFIQSIPLHWTAAYQTFRVFVEMILLATFIQGVIPVEATYEGYNFDILIGFSALFISALVYKTGNKYKNFLRLWNIFGIMMILFVAFIIASSIYQPQLWGYTESPVSFSFLSLPYLLIPTFLAPSAIFIHIISLIQLNKKIEKEKNSYINL